jgi:hypothetical protein
VLESQTFHNTNAVDHTSKPAFTSPQSSTLPAETIVFVPDAELIAEQEEEDLLRRIQQHPVVRI